MAEQGFGHSRPDDVTRAGYGTPGQPPYQAAPEQQASYGSAAGYNAPSQQLPGTKGFVASLFDFGFDSFVTPKVVKVVYVLIMVVLGLIGLVFAISAFAYKPLVGIFVLVVVAPLFFFVYLALWRIALEIFVVIFRIADDIRAIRTSGGFR